MTFCYYSLPDHVAQCMVLLVYREDCGVRDFCIEFFYDPEILLIRLCYLSPCMELTSSLPRTAGTTRMSGVRSWWSWKI